MAAILNSYFVQCGPFVYQTIWIVDSNLSGFWKLQVFNVPYSSAHCVVYFDQRMHACACVHTVENDKKHQKWWKKYLFQLFLRFSSWALHKPLIQIMEKVLFKWNDWHGFSQSEGSILVPNLVFNYGLAFFLWLPRPDVWIEYHSYFIPMQVKNVTIWIAGRPNFHIFTVTIWIRTAWNLKIFFPNTFYVPFSNGLIIWLGGSFDAS